MDHQPAQHAHALLSVLDTDVAEPAIRPLERLVARAAAGDSLIAAIVGVSGVGKSSIVNALAGTRVVAVGPLRPTTTEISIWGDIDDTYLSGARVSGGNLLSHITLVDTPAAEHFPEAVMGTLDLIDVAIVVVSPDRYADAITATLLASVRARGIPMRVVLSTDTRDLSGFDDVIEDANTKLGVSTDVVVRDDARSLNEALDEMAGRRGDLMERRDRAAASVCAALTRDVADVLDERTVEAQTVIAKADEAFAHARIDRGGLASIADGDWDPAALAIVDMAADATDRAIDELARAVEPDEVASASVANAGTSLPAIDRAPIDEWHRDTTSLAVTSVKRRWLHPLRKRAVRDEVWRLALDFDRRPSKRVRKGLRGRLADLRYERGTALETAVGEAGSARIAAFRTELDPSNQVSPSDLRAAADTMDDAAALPGEAIDDDA